MKKARRIISVFCLLFTSLTLINFMLQKELDARLMLTLIAVSAIDSVLALIMEEKDSYTNRRVLLNQIIYAGLVFLSVVTAYLVNRYTFTLLSLMLNAVAIAVLFAGIKGFLYAQDTKEADEMNRKLAQRNHGQATGK